MNECFTDLDKIRPSWKNLDGECKSHIPQGIEKIHHKNKTESLLFEVKMKELILKLI